MYRGDVQLVRWPEEEAERQRLAEAGQLCLLVIETNMAPPADLQPGEDWVRSTADPIEVRSRIDRLRAAHEHQHRRPTVDEDGILTFGERWVALAPGDVALARVLCEQFTNLVAREDLRRCAVPPCSDATLAVKLYRLRRHLTQVGLRLTTIRSRGCILESAQAAQPTVESVG